MFCGVFFFWEPRLQPTLQKASLNTEGLVRAGRSALWVGTPSEPPGTTTAGESACESVTIEPLRARN